jgi:hypothetical protein
MASGSSSAVKRGQGRIPRGFRGSGGFLRICGLRLSFALGSSRLDHSSARDDWWRGGHTPHVTRHTPLATRHTPHATRHSPHVTRHTSHATRHSPLATRQTSHATRHSPLVSATRAGCIGQRVGLFCWQRGNIMLDYQHRCIACSLPGPSANHLSGSFQFTAT